MLDLFVIDEIRKQEELEKEKEEPVVELPLFEYDAPGLAPVVTEDRGVVVIDL